MILDDIIAFKKKEVQRAKEQYSQESLHQELLSLNSLPRSLNEALTRESAISLIAEVKKASPSRGVLREDFDPLEIAKCYEAAGAQALSILTDKNFFQGELSYLKSVQASVALPLLRKDFIIDEYQIYQSRCAHADAVLLIARILSEDQLSRFLTLSGELKLEALCEVHDENDLEKALTCGAQMIGINNRNLKNFEVDLQLSVRLKKRIPKGKTVVSESGITSRADVKLLRDIGIDAVLIGEVFMRAEDIALKVRELMGNGQD